jgi:hypothetical protein
MVGNKGSKEPTKKSIAAENKGSKEPRKIVVQWRTKVQRNLDDGSGSGQRFEGTFKNSGVAATARAS